MTLELTNSFVDMLYGDSEGLVSVWWRTEPGSKSPYSRSAWFNWPEDREKLAEFAESIADKDVCLTVSTYDDKRRVPDHVRNTQVIWMDSDVCAGENYRIPPTWTTVTSKDRWQHFWALDKPISTLDASELSHRMAIAHDKDGADPSSWPSNKIMRLPGTMNTSHGFPTRVKAETTGELYSFEDLAAAYADVVIPNRALVRETVDIHEDELPLYSNVLAKLSSELVELATSEPHEGQDRSRLRYRLLLDLFRFGLSFEEVLSVAWNAPASRKWSEEDARGLHGLIAEALKAQDEADTPSAQPVDPYGADSDDVELAVEKPAVVLTEEERDWIEANPSFIDRYNIYARGRLQHHNEVYDRILAWELLSLAYMDTGYMPMPGNQKGALNFYGCVVGDTTTGKSSSFRLFRGVTRELFNNDPEFNIGGNASESALIKALHARDGKVSFFNSDEASGVLKTWIGQDWTSGMQERITELYDGEVTPYLRSAKGESVLKSTRALFSVFLAGTQRGVMQYMTPELFHTGFIPRFIFGIGEPRHTDYNSYAPPQSDGKESLSGFDPVARQIAATLRSNRLAVREYYKGEAPITRSAEADKRLQDACWALDREYTNHPLWEMIQPAIFRWRDNVIKASCLLAMDNRRTEVEVGDMLHALSSGEEWFTNMIRIITRLSSGQHERSCAEIYNYVTGRGGRVGVTSLYRKFQGIRSYDFNDYLQSLERQGRLFPETERRSGRKYFVTDAYKSEHNDKE